MAQNEAVASPGKAPYTRTTYAVWEITLKCNLACSHCGSRAGDARVEELTTAEALDLVHQLAEEGIREVSLIGGEAFLRKDWLEIAAEIKRCGMKPTMTTGGLGISQRTADRMREAGIDTVSVSIDGLEATHDFLRGKPGSWQSCFKTIGYLTKAGISVGSNCQINRLSAPQLPMIYQLLKDTGVRAWQIQLTVPMGNAADHTEILLQPWELLDLYPLLGFLAEKGAEEGLIVQAGNNVGYYGPYERLLRGGKYGGHPDAFYKGCQAGLNVLGIEADGAIKGCPSLPTQPYTGGNIRQMKLHDIVHSTDPLKFNEKAATPQSTDHLWGHCKSCEFAKLCRGGCNWTAHVFFGKRGNNPYCHHRALKRAGQGQRERFTMKEAAKGLPFDYGIFEIQDEPADTPANLRDEFTLDRIQFPESWLEVNPDLVVNLKKERRDTIRYYADQTGNTVPV